MRREVNSGLWRKQFALQRWDFILSNYFKVKNCAPTQTRSLKLLIFVSDSPKILLLHYMGSAAPRPPYHRLLEMIINLVLIDMFDLRNPHLLFHNSDDVGQTADHSATV